MGLEKIVSGNRRRLTTGAVLALIGAALVVALVPCPQQGCALTPAKRALVRLKNRAGLPADTDFDRRVTLDALVAPGEDRVRWSESRAAAIEGYVVAVERGAVEASNCFSLTRRDVHIRVALRRDAPPQEIVVLEVTPRGRDAARARGLDWSPDALRRDLVGHRCRFEGWLLFDREHADESENIAPGNPVAWRATAWELHPVTRIEVIE
jgi:hypothetical protein